jgi:hypothetical protein
MRFAVALLLLGAVVRADEYEDVVNEVVAGRLERARDMAATYVQRLPADKGLAALHAAVVTAIEARDLQRAQGYGAAIDYLDARLDHWLLAEAFAETCRWGGREARGVERLRSSGLALEERIRPELDLLHAQLRHKELESRAREAKAELAKKGIDWPLLDEWIRIAGEEAALRAGLRGRGTRAGWLALGGAVAMLGAWALLMRAAKRR